MSKATELFEIQTRLAVGDAALVYRAVDPSGRRVALKLLLKEHQISHPLDVESLLRDAPVIQSIVGVNIVQLLDAFPDEDGTVLVYEYAEGHRGLDVPNRRPISAEQAVDVAAQLLSALRSGERQRIPHGDLKPSDTVIVDLPEGRPLVMVLDWALANFRKDITQESFAYTAPERLEGGPPSHVADLFSAGATLHYLFTGKRLLPYATRGEFAIAWPSLDVHALATLRPDLSKALVAWVGKLIAPDPAQRPESAVKALEALAALHPPLPPAVPEDIRPRVVRAAPPPPPPPKPVAAPVSAIRSAPPRASAAHQVPQQISDDAAAVIAETHKEIAKIANKRQALMLYSILLLFLASIGFGGFLYWKSRPANTTAEADNPVPDMPRKGVEPTPAKVVAAPPEPKVAADKTSKKKPAAQTPAPAAKNPPPAPAPAPAPEPPPASQPKPDEKSALLASDPFDYAQGANVTGLAGGSGWDGPWTGEGGEIDGGAMLLKPNVKDAFLSRIYAPGMLDPVDPKQGRFLYVAITVLHDDAKPSAEAEFQFHPLDPANIRPLFRVIVAKVGADIEVSIKGSPIKPLVVKDDKKPLRIVQRVELVDDKTGTWTVKTKLYVNPKIPDSGPPKTADIELPDILEYKLPGKIGLMIRKKRTSTSRVLDVQVSQRWKRFQ